MTVSHPSRVVTVCRLLNAAGVRYVVIGGFALALHGAVRATRDIDILIEPTVENARRALQALEQLRFGVARKLDPAAVAAKPLAVIGDDPGVDLLTLAWSVRYADAAPRRQTVEIEGVEIPTPISLHLFAPSRPAGCRTRPMWNAGTAPAAPAGRPLNGRKARLYPLHGDVFRDLSQPLQQAHHRPGVPLAVGE